MSAFAEVIERAIRRSLATGEVVHLDHSDFGRRRGDALEDARGDLISECADDVDAGGTHEFWGVDVDGNEWRVHVRYAEVSS